MLHHCLPEQRTTFNISNRHRITTKHHWLVLTTIGQALNKGQALYKTNSWTNVAGFVKSTQRFPQIVHLQQMQSIDHKILVPLIILTKSIWIIPFFILKLLQYIKSYEWINAAGKFMNIIIYSRISIWCKHFEIRDTATIIC